MFSRLCLILCVVTSGVSATVAAPSTRPSTEPLINENDVNSVRQHVRELEKPLYDQKPELKAIEARLAELIQKNEELWTAHLETLDLLEKNEGEEAKSNYDKLMWQWIRRTWGVLLKDDGFAEKLRDYRVAISRGRGLEDERRFLKDVDSASDLDAATGDQVWGAYRKWMLANVDRMTEGFDRSAKKFNVPEKLVAQAKAIGELEAEALVYGSYVNRNTSPQLKLWRAKLKRLER
jgi:hypothetical protein